MIACWKGIIEEIHFGVAIFENLDLKKPSFGPSKWPRKLKTAKNSKLPNLLESSFEPVGKGGCPPISTWIKWVHKFINTLEKTPINWYLQEELCLTTSDWYGMTQKFVATFLFDSQHPTVDQALQVVRKKSLGRHLAPLWSKKRMNGLRLFKNCKDVTISMLMKTMILGM
jgi:hypothetical protein